MSTRTVRLDDETEQALAEAIRATGASVSGVLKRGILAVRESVRADAAVSPWDAYAALDLGPVGTARGPARKAKSVVRQIIRRKHGR